MLGDRDSARVGFGGRQTADRRWRRELDRRLADDVLERGAGDDQLALHADPVGGRVRQPRFGLGNVGARHLADFEAIPRRLELALQALLVVEREIENGAPTHDVHIGRDGVEEDLLFDFGEARAVGQHEMFGLCRRGDRPAAPVDRLGKRQRIGFRRPRLVGREEARFRIDAVLADRGRRRQDRPPPRDGLRDALVGRPQRDPLREQRRVALVRRNQRLLHRLRSRVPAPRGRPAGIRTRRRQNWSCEALAWRSAR